MLPLNLRSQRTTMRMQKLQPQIKAIQTKYKENPQKMQEEFRTIGYNPAEQMGGCLIMFLQFPIFIGLYRAIILVLSTSPLGMANLAARNLAMSPDKLAELLPVKNTFAWLNLAQPDPFFILPALVVGTMIISQRLLTAKPAGGKKPAADDPSAQMQKQMQFMMPVMFGFISLQFPAGVSIYFIFANLISMIQSYIVKRSLKNEDDNKSTGLSAVSSKKNGGDKKSKRFGISGLVEEAKEQASKTVEKTKKASAAGSEKRNKKNQIKKPQSKRKRLKG